jgi:signal transduction histidine kinase
VPDTLSTEKMPPSPMERAMLEQADAQRRMSLLRFIVPAFLVVLVLAIPFAVQADVESGASNSSVQLGIGAFFFGIALWGVWKRRANVASFAFFAGVTGVIIALLVTDIPASGSIDISVLPEFQLLLLPIVVAGIFGGARLVALATVIANAVTLSFILLTPHTLALEHRLQANGGLVLFTIPLSVQLALGALMAAATRGFSRTLRELGNIRVAYAREKELDRLKDQFISSVNHELRTPIMALQGYLSLARELGRRGDLDRQDMMLGRGSEAVEHLAGLVKSVLNVRRIEADTASLKLEQFALRPVIIGATHLLDPREAGPQERELHLHVPADLVVRADEDRVRQVVLNLLSNASKYSSPGSPIEVTARAVEPSPDRHDHFASRTPQVEVAVRDHGLGVPPAQAPLLFERFVRLERDIASTVVGTGLGLAICRAYVEAMGGRIWVESSGVEGEGSTFRFTLPLAEHAKPVPALASITAEQEA